MLRVNTLQLSQVIPRARNGHVGAQLALLRERACGQQVDVYWEIDDTFFPGQITTFDDMNYIHRIDYDDGDVRFVKLWKCCIKLR